MLFFFFAKGWNHGSGPFSTIVNDPGMRASFVKNSVDFLISHGFDGLG